MFTYTLVRTSFVKDASNRELMITDNFNEMVTAFKIAQNALITTDYSVQVQVTTPYIFDSFGTDYLLEMGDLMSHAASLDIKRQIRKLEAELADLV